MTTTNDLVTETFISVNVADMERATAFYKAALGATVSHAVPFWTSLHVAGVRVGLFLSPGHRGAHTGLHFAVRDLEAARTAVVQAGGGANAPIEVAPGVVGAEATDTEGNSFSLRG